MRDRRRRASRPFKKGGRNSPGNSIDCFGRLILRGEVTFLSELSKIRFALFDLDPEAAFRILGEQIDGAFTFDGTYF